jgi:hypothetical protein
MKSNATLSFILEQCTVSSITPQDINPKSFFNKLVHTEVPFTGDVFEYIEDLQDGMLESSSKMFVSYNHIMKLNSKSYNEFIDSGDVDMISLDVFETYEDTIEHYNKSCYKPGLYVVSREYDLDTKDESYSIARIVLAKN